MQMSHGSVYLDRPCFPLHVCACMCLCVRTASSPLIMAQCIDRCSLVLFCLLLNGATDTIWIWMAVIITPSVVRVITIVARTAKFGRVPPLLFIFLLGSLYIPFFWRELDQSGTFPPLLMCFLHVHSSLRASVCCPSLSCAIASMVALKGVNHKHGMSCFNESY